MHKMTSKLTFKRTFAALAAGVCFFASLSAFGQYNPNIQQNVQPNAFSQTGYTNDGTLFMGGQRIGNPHQVLHDLNVPSFFGVNADRLSYSDSSYGQGTLAQMENHTLTIGVPAGNVVLSRLYVTPTNPYTEGVATPHNNYQTYQGVVADAQAGSYQPTVANDNKLYVFKTLGAMNTQSQNILIKELPAHSVFIANSDPLGGAVAVRVTQSGDYAAMQNYLDTVKPYDFSWRSAMGAWADGTARPDNLATLPGVGGQIGNDEAGFVFFNWVMGSNAVKAQQKELQYKAEIIGGETFGVLTWDSAQNKYVTVYPNDVQSSAHSVSGTMPVLGQNQTAVFGMHTHPHTGSPSSQDIRMTETLGLDQVVLGSDGASSIFSTKPSSNWQGKGFKFEGAYIDSVSGSGTGSSNGVNDPKGVGGVSSGIASPDGVGVYVVGGNSGNSANGLILDSHGYVIGGDVLGNTDYQRQYFAAMWDRYLFGVPRLLRAGYTIYSLASKRSSGAQADNSINSPSHAADATTLIENRATPWRGSGNFNVESDTQLMNLYNDLAANGEAVPSVTDGGASSVLSDGTQISLRVDSKTGGMTIDISRRSTGQSPIKVHIRAK